MADGRASPNDEPTRTFPWWIALVLKIVAVLGALVLAEYPTRPIAASMVRNPVTHHVFRFLRSHSYPVPFLTTWSFEGMRRIPPGTRWTFFAIVVVLACIPPSLALPARLRVRVPWRPWFRIPLAIVLGAIAALLFRKWHVSLAVSHWFGDGPALPVFFGRGDLEPGDVATTDFFQLARWYLNTRFHDNDPTHAILLVDFVSGGFFVAALVHFVCVVGRGFGERVSLFAALVAAGYTGMFFGYIETTQVQTAIMALYFAAAASAILGETERSRDAGRVWVFFLLGLSATAHGAGVLLWPSGLFVAGDLLAMRRDPRRTMRELFSAANVAFAIALMATPWLLLVFVPFFSRKIYGNAGGGGDAIMFVPRHVDYAHLPSPWVYYARFSRWHLADIANGLWISSPFGAVLAAIGLSVKRMTRLVWGSGPARLVTLAGTAALFCAVIPLFWNHDFGVWGDWNITVTYWFPLQVFGWLAFLLGTRGYRRGVGFYLGVVAPLVAVQFGAWMGLFGQLYA